MVVVVLLLQIALMVVVVSGVLMVVVGTGWLWLRLAAQQQHAASSEQPASNQANTIKNKSSPARSRPLWEDQQRRRVARVHVLPHALRDQVAVLHFGPVEPQAAERVEHLRLQEPDPAAVELHDDGEGRVGRQDDVIDHRRVVGDPDAPGAGRRPRAVEADDAGPGRDEAAFFLVWRGGFCVLFGFGLVCIGVGWSWVGSSWP